MSGWGLEVPAESAELGGDGASLAAAGNLVNRTADGAVAIGDADRLVVAVVGEDGRHSVPLVDALIFAQVKTDRKPSQRIIFTVANFSGLCILADMDPLTELVARVEAHLGRTGMNATDFGRDVLNNTALVSRLRTGNVTARTMRAVSDYLAKQSRPRSPSLHKRKRKA